MLSAASLPGPTDSAGQLNAADESDGADWLFDLLTDGTPDTYVAYAEDHFERPVARTAVAAVQSGTHLTRETVTALSPTADLRGGGGAGAGAGLRGRRPPHALTRGETMGAKTGLLMYADGDIPGLLRHTGAPDPDRTSALVRRSFPDAAIERCQGSNLYSGVHPPPGRADAGSWPGVDVLADQRLMIDTPSQLPEHLVSASAGRRLVLHAMHSVVDWLACAV